MQKTNDEVGRRSGRPGKPMLRLKRVTRRFGGLVALNEVSFDLYPNEIVGLIGPNGAGKTTLVNTVTGFFPPSQGEIFFDDNRIDKLKPHVIARLGISRTFQVVQPFPNMTVLENVAAGAVFAGGLTGLSAAKDVAERQLDFLNIRHLANVTASSLSLADRRRLELAKSLAMNPKLLFLDEVNAGLNSTELNRSIEVIQNLQKSGLTILIIEHLMKVVMSICTRIIVLHHGQMISEGTPSQVANNAQVIEAYLGSRFAKLMREK